MFRKNILSLIAAVSLFVAATPLYADLVDLSVNTSGTVTAGTGQLTTFERFNDPPTGTGVFNPFVRIQSKGEEKGYNTDGTPEFDTKSGTWTHSIKLGDLLIMNGNLEFLLDINQDEKGDDELLSLDVLKIFLADSPDLDDYAGGLGTLVYDLGDNWVKIDNSIFNPGSGTGDVRALIPVDPSWSADKYLYLYSEFGAHNNSNAGFEEWSVSAGIVPEPTTIALLGLGSLILIRKRSMK